MLAVSGELDTRRAGPHPFPPIERWPWTQHNPFKATYPSKRRTVFLMTQRLVKHPYLAIFDGPDTNTSTDVRTRSTVPLQALYLMNNPFVQEQAAAPGPEGHARDGLITVVVSTEPGNWPGAARRHPASKSGPEVISRPTATAWPTRVIPRIQSSVEAWTSLCKVLLIANEFLYLE